MHSVPIKDKGGYASRFQVSSGLDGNKMSGGYPSWGVWSSIGVSRSSRPSRASWCLSKGNVECISDVLRVLVVGTGARGRFIALPRYNGSRDGLDCCHHSLCRHNIAIV